MEFEEKSYIKLQSLPLSFIYFLIDNKEVVYIGQTKRGTGRIFSHMNNKEFDEVYIIPCEESRLDEMEGYYIEKYIPMYNACPNLRYTCSISNILNDLNTFYANTDAGIKHSKKFNRNRINKIMKKLELSYITINGKSYIRHNDYIKIVDKVEEYIMGVEKDEIFSIGF